MAEEMARLGSHKAAAVLRRWASLAGSGAEQLKQADWGAMQAFIGAAKPRLVAKESQMKSP